MSWCSHESAWEGQPPCLYRCKVRTKKWKYCSTSSQHTCQKAGGARCESQFVNQHKAKPTFQACNRWIYFYSIPENFQCLSPCRKENRNVRNLSYISKVHSANVYMKRELTQYHIYILITVNYGHIWGRKNSPNSEVIAQFSITIRWDWKYLTLGAHGSPLGKDTLSVGGWGMGGGMASSLSSGNVSASKELSLSSLSSSSSRESSAL